MTTVKLPRTIEEATGRLVGIDALLTAKGWERAAIVWAFTEDAHGRRNFSGYQEKLSFKAFAELGIRGLSEADTVAHYRKAWQTAIDEGGADEVAPGEAVDLPERTFPPRKGNEGTRATPSTVSTKMADETFADQVVRQQTEDALDTTARAVYREQLRRKDPDTPEEVLLEAVGEGLHRRGEVINAFAVAAEALDRAGRGLEAMDEAERRYFDQHLATMAERIDVLRIIVAGAPDDLSALEADR